MKHILIGLAFSSLLLLLLLPACKHELGPISIEPDPNDTIVVPPPPPDLGDTTGVPCSGDTVYFQNQILPLMISTCALSNCHNVQSHEEGVITTDYAHIMQHIKPFYPNQSKIYKVIIDNDPGDRMPRPPASPWTQAQINLLKKWIEQGALNNACNENYGQCDTSGVTYTAFVQPLVANYCLGCHGNSNPGAGIKLTSYNEVKACAQSGKFYNSIAWAPGYSAMPQNGNQLSACYVSKIRAWVEAGMPQ
ncbi:MAG TPA: hypothetical protein PKL15_05370 [Saprospiraceae bacterium]|nr:hypothetical protein [Saprospiraceae bacterium]